MARKVMTATEDAHFAALWACEVPVAVLQEIFGLSAASSVNSVRVRLSLAPRGKVRPAGAGQVAAKAGAGAGAGSPDADALAALPAMPAHPYWTPARDLVVFGTAGRYAQLAEAARVLGKPMAHVQHRWHQLRAA